MGEGLGWAGNPVPPIRGVWELGRTSVEDPVCTPFPDFALCSSAPQALTLAVEEYLYPRAGGGYHQGPLALPFSSAPHRSYPSLLGHANSWHLGLPRGCPGRHAWELPKVVLGLGEHGEHLPGGLGWGTPGSKYRLAGFTNGSQQLTAVWQNPSRADR